MIFPRFLRFPSDIPDDLRHNFIHLLFDIGWWGLYVGTTAAFLPIYAARSGASNTQIGLLSAVPALVALTLSLPAGRVLKRFPARPATAAAALVSRLLLVVFALIPWLLPPSLQVSSILILAVTIAVPSTFVGISFGQFFMEGVPIGWRGTIVGARNAIMSVTSFAVTIVSGQILIRLPFPLGYQVVFFIGFIGAVMTSYHIWHVIPIAASPILEPTALPALKASQAAGPLSRLKIGPAEIGYLKVIGLLFLFNLTNNMVAPLLPDLLVHKLGFSDATISVGTGLANILVFSVSLFIARLTRKAGNRRATALGAALLAFHAFALAFARDASIYLLSAVVGGIASGVLGTAQYNYHLDCVPEEGRATWLSWNYLLGNAAVLLGALAGPAAAHLTGTPTALIGFGILRFLFGAAIFLWG